MGVLLTRFYKRLEDPEQTLQQERDMLHLLLRVLVWIVWIRLENLGAHVGVDLAQTLVQEAPDAGEVAVRSFEVLRYGVYPVVGLRLRFDLLLVLVVLERDVELKAFLLSEACLHNGVPRHVQDVGLDQLLCWVFDLLRAYAPRIGVDQRLARARRNLRHGEPKLLLALLDRGDKDFAHCALELDLDDSLEFLHLGHELLRYLDVHVLLLVVSHLLSGLGVEHLDLALLLIDDPKSLILTVKSAVLDELDELAKSEGVLFAQVI